MDKYARILKEECSITALNLLFDDDIEKQLEKISTLYSSIDMHDLSVSGEAIKDLHIFSGYISIYPREIETF